eukprot:2098935-Amphidinium_carterae.1
MSAAFSESHWASVPTLLQLFSQIEAHVYDCNGELKAYLVVIDCAPVHCSAQFLGELAEKHPMAHLVFVPPRM